MGETMSQEEVKRAANGMKKAQLEQRFLEAWRRNFPQLPKPDMQFRFDPRRRWRFDFSWGVPYLVAVEIQGGSFIRGGHNRGAQQQRDFEKQRAAVMQGWRVLPFNTKDLDDPDWVVQQVAELLTNAKDVA